MNALSKEFIKALESEDIEAVRKVPKADLHNHFVLGGLRSFIHERTGLLIKPFEGVLNSMDDMHRWNNRLSFKGMSPKEIRQLKIDATFAQAQYDGIKIIEIGEDVWGLNEFFDGDVEALVNAFESSRQKYAKATELRLQIGISRHCSAEYLLESIAPFLESSAFYSLDLYGDELAQPIEVFKPIYKNAKARGLKLKAHVGEWGTADDIRRAVEVLELDEVQHGIQAVHSKEVLKYLRDNKIRLNITPTSNIKLGRVESLKVHPLKELYQYGIDVTINSDDLLMFDSDVSMEYLKLYQEKVLSSQELNDIRLNGLRPA